MLMVDHVILLNIASANATVWKVVDVLLLKVAEILKAICHSAAVAVVDQGRWPMFFRNNHKIWIQIAALNPPLSSKLMINGWLILKSYGLFIYIYRDCTHEDRL